MNSNYEYNQYVNSIYNVNRKKKKKSHNFNIESEFFHSEISQNQENSLFNVKYNDRVNEKINKNDKKGIPIDEFESKKLNNEIKNHENNYTKYKSSYFQRKEQLNTVKKSLKKFDELENVEAQKKQELSKRLKGYDKQVYLFKFS